MAVFTDIFPATFANHLLNNPPLNPRSRLLEDSQTLP